jgi:hypothetical protein
LKQVTNTWQFSKIETSNRLLGEQDLQVEQDLPSDGEKIRKKHTSGTEVNQKLHHTYLIEKQHYSLSWIGLRNHLFHVNATSA